MLTISHYPLYGCCVERRARLQRKAPMRQAGGPTSRNTPTPARGKPLRPRSDKREQQMSAYRPRARAFLEANRRCQFPLGCTALSTEVHHRWGREGERLLDERYWAASCSLHNQLAETDTGLARGCRWLLDTTGHSEPSPHYDYSYRP